MSYLNLNKDEALKILTQQKVAFQKFKELNLKLDMSRGKPCKEQLDISMGLLDMLNSGSKVNYGADYRNYGILDGIDEIKDIFCNLCNLRANEIIVAGNSSLNLMYDSLQRAMQFGVLGLESFNRQGKIKWLCPAPGYDRHFAVTELFGIEMITIPMNNDGPDMDLIEKLVSTDDTIKGIWCVPKYSNPQGIVYSDKVVERFARLRPLAKDFRIYWDNAYMIHAIEDGGDELMDIFAASKKYNNEDIVLMFGSTSKITFAGAGVAFVAGSEHNMKDALKYMTIQTIGPDKINQLAHSLYFKNSDGLTLHMKKHEAIMKPKFDTVDRILNEELGDCGIITWLKPRGGYFVSVDLLNGCAKRAIQLCKEAGVIFTPAGSTYPYKNDINDSNLRIAPSLPPIAELESAMKVFAVCVKIAALEKLLNL